MHRSRLAGFIIDCRTDDLDTAATFWGAALGYRTRKVATPEEANYVRLETGEENLHIEVQKVDHPSRVHLDIETDDIEAEVKRLEKLGAKRIGNVHTWCVMEAPTGQRFCVVQVQNPGFDATARTWEE
jgi:predicted enzyme related to lactoylglutathione lyase